MNQNRRASIFGGIILILLGGSLQISKFVIDKRIGDRQEQMDRNRRIKYEKTITNLKSRIIEQSEQLQIDDILWPKIVRPLGFDAGLRTLQRTLKGISRKIAMLVVQGKIQSIHLTTENIKEYLPKE